MALTELLQNAVEHGFGHAPGSIRLGVERSADRLRVTVEDDGVGLPADFDPHASASLGLSIVRTLVESELGGTLAIGPGPDGGTRARIDVPLEQPGR
jgi:two-component sensor histidine kinase